MIYGSWDMKREEQNFLSFWTIFCPFSLLTTWKIKKTPKDIILYMCTIVDNHMMYGSWYIKCDGQVLLSFWTFFALLPPNNQKNQNFEKMKNLPGDIIILLKFTKNHDHILHCSWDMVLDECNCYCSFGAILSPCTP